MLNLKEFIRITQGDYDCYDTVWDASITVCYDEDSNEPYDLFIDNIVAHVNVLERFSECELLCDWTEMILENIETFRKAAQDKWYHTPDDEDELVYQWIKELHLLFAGYVSDEDYTDYNRYFSFLRRAKK